MNLYGHMLAKDCRRLAIPLGIWLLLLGINTYLLTVDNSALGPDPSGPSPSFGLLLGLWSVASTVCFWFLTVYIAAGMVLDDPPKGTTAFWLTRPFARGQVAAAKLSLLLALSIIPLLVKASLLAAYGVGPKAITVTFFSGLLSTAVVPLAVAAFAVTAETFGQFAITTILILFGCGIVSVIYSGFFWKIHQMMGPVRNAPYLPQPTLGESKQLAGQLIGLILAFGIVLWRYQRRHARFTLVVVAGSVLACIFIWIFWSWDFIGVG